jgi:hypothetical protein
MILIYQSELNIHEINFIFKLIFKTVIVLFVLRIHFISLNNQVFNKKDFKRFDYVILFFLFYKNVQKNEIYINIIFSFLYLKQLKHFI